MKIMYKIFLVILIVCIPFTSILAAYNIVFRLPDLYVYEFNSGEITKEIDLGITDDELGHFFSDFMLGKHQDFDLNADYRGREQAVFGAGEQIAMDNLRDLLNIMLISLAVMVLLILIIYWMFLLKKNKLALRFAFKGGVIVFVIMVAVFIAAFNVPVINEFLQQFIFVAPFGADDVLPLMLTEKFARDCLAASTLVSMIILVICGSITWRLTKPRRMFW